ncbi:Hypothetical predicted protein, partial [Mytilus galloprovincialis]
MPPAKPIIVNPTSNQHIQVKYHTDVRITCIATGYPVPIIGYEFLHTIPFPTNFVRENENTLLIANYNKENDGSYHCYAVNTIGTASLTCLSCSDNLAQPHDCNRVTRCGDHE